MTRIQWKTGATVLVSALLGTGCAASTPGTTKPLEPSIFADSIEYAEHLDKSLRREGDPSRVLSDEDLLRYAHQPFKKEDLAFRRVMLGRYRGTPVVADYPCSDLCPDHTQQIIHYNVLGLDECEALGGLTKVVSVPYSIGDMRVRFCFPDVLVCDCCERLRHADPPRAPHDDETPSN